MTAVASTLHVVSGDSGAAGIKEAFGLTPDLVLIQRDPVSYGPAPQTSDLREWRAIREQFLKGIHPRFPDFSFDEWKQDDLILNFSRLNAAPMIVAWLGEGTADQLFAAWLIHYLRATQCDLAKLHFVTFARGSWRSILSAGELSAEQIRELASGPVPAAAEQADELALVWQSYSSDNPRALATYLDTHAGPLRDAIAPILMRYPEVKSGLGFWDRLLLENARDHGPKLARAIGNTMIPIQPENYLDSVGDGFLFDRAIRMSSPLAARPLISVCGNRQEMRACTVALTEDGVGVLAAERNAVQLNGIDDWIGGVHLTPSTVVFRDEARLI
ncbi:MAG: DUF1835 domain-containing protein [Alphaproteobacteria bacterium]|nr:DUF1835 domain-containing protein [Alphaproteobacteria bacterium]